ncbi:MAG: aminoacyl-tRNA hydrolase [Clostridiales bacterium]|nr:aminoacyl-tRNA hydrolase [Clostridiales bacterium]
MRLIAGLGNPERDYRGTRHNMGFETLNKLAFDHDIKMKTSKFRAISGDGTIHGEKVMLFKPQTYMNLSGEAVRDAINFYKLTHDDLIVVYDDIDLELGDTRVRETGSAGSHNGMKSVIYQLGAQDFIRVRAGIGPKPNEWDLSAFVTSRFRPDDIDKMVEGVAKAAAAVETILKSGVKEAMNMFNRRAKNKIDRQQADGE